MSPRHKRTLEGRFVLRADSIRPYSLGGEAAAIQRTAQLRGLREAKSLPYGEESVVPYSGIVGVVGVVGIVGVVAGVVGAAAAGGIWKPRIFPLAEVSVTSPPMTLFL